MFYKFTQNKRNNNIPFNHFIWCEFFKLFSSWSNVHVIIYFGIYISEKIKIKTTKPNKSHKIVLQF